MFKIITKIIIIIIIVSFLFSIVAIYIKNKNIPNVPDIPDIPNVSGNFKLLIGQNNVNQFNLYTNYFSTIKNNIFGGSVYTTQPKLDGPPLNWTKNIIWETNYNKNNIDLLQYINLLTIKPNEIKYIQTTIGFKYSNIDKEGNRPIYVSYLQNWSQKSGDFSYINKYADYLYSINQKYPNITWLLRFEYEVSIDQHWHNTTNISWQQLRLMYAKSFLNVKKIFKQKLNNNIKMIFHPVIGIDLQTNNSTNWLNVFQTASQQLQIYTNDYYPDILGFSMVFGIKEQLQLGIKNIQTWKEITKKEVIWSETSVDPYGKCMGYEHYTCTTLHDLLQTVIETHSDYFVYINTTDKIAETKYSSAIQLFNYKYRNWWTKNIKRFAKINK
jgi:hypothetical protein